MNVPIAIAEKIVSKLNKVKQRFTGRHWPNKSIVYYTGHTDYQWSPDSLKTGLGGADARIVYLSREWVKLGYSVAVYSNCGDREGLYDGVEYYHHTKFNPCDRFDTLIMWQFAWRLQFPMAANRVWLDLGKGVLLPHEAEYDKLKNYDKIFCKTSFHRNSLPEVPDEKVAVIPNGVDSSYLDLVDAKKDPYKIIYASNYIRGLDRMLEWGWPIIREQIPEATLYIYYGWPRKIEPEWQAKMETLMSLPGVVNKGKVGRKELMKAKSTSSIHYYGCTFQETDCNTVRESAFIGCVPVTTDYAGLTDKDYCLRVPGNPYERETQEQLAWKIVELLKDRERLAQLRQEFMALAQIETWERTAKLWLDWIN